MQITGAMFILFGLLLIVSNKIEYHRTILPHSIHSIFGILTIVALCGQAVAGQQKYNQIQDVLSMGGHFVNNDVTTSSSTSGHGQGRIRR